MARYLLYMLALLGLSACQQTQFTEDKTFAGGVIATVDELNLGASVYTTYCLTCHGNLGDGQGISSKGSTSPPRDFRMGIFKFGQVAAGGLPHDQDLMQIVLRGLKGTSMLPWKISEKDAHAVIQYIKTFAPKTWEGKDKSLGKRIDPGPDPFGFLNRLEAANKGKIIYHTATKCQTCHRGYMDKTELMLKLPPSEIAKAVDENYFTLKPQDSSFGHKITPPDFTVTELKSAQTMEELYVRIAAGIGGTKMTSLTDTLRNEDLWALAYYVQSLVELRPK
ncbi:MAG: cytochrome c [Bdellovibrio sp.]|nr:cytochrome c [Bdellovibrio sp.]